jgi:thioredoxin-dependent peroxiredoxin
LSASEKIKTLKEGGKAPAFSLLSDSGETIRLADFKGQKIVLYFYPRDNTPGCTQEACDFEAGLKAFKKKGAIVLGVSPDSEKSHVKFKTKYSLSFPLLVDEGSAVAMKYGVWQEKSLYGRKYMGIVRSTFIIDEEGKIQKIFPKVSVKGHTAEVLAAL